MERTEFIILTWVIQKEPDGRWTARCEELGTSTFGHSFEETKDCLDEAILLHLNGLEEVGERERFFKEHGIRIFGKQSKPICKDIRIEDGRVTYSMPQVLQFAGAC